jgi:hypothetical protein
MSNLEEQLEKIPIVRNIVRLTQRVKLPWLEGLSLYELLRLYIIGIAQGAFSYRAGAIAFSFFMALFPFTLFILNLLPFIPIPNFQEDFLEKYNSEEISEKDILEENISEEDILEKYTEYKTHKYFHSDDCIINEYGQCKKGWVYFCLCGYGIERYYTECKVITCSKYKGIQKDKDMI